MPWLIALVLILGGLCWAGFAVRAQAQEKKAPVTVEQVSNASSAEIERMLRDVETRPAPEPKMGAMCYKVAMSAPATEYVCPVCGEKTVYPLGEKQWQTPLNGLEDLRSLQAKAQEQAQRRQASVTLDEKQFCRQCLPDFTNTPQAVLVVELPDGREQRTERVGENDLRMLRDFFAGRNVLKGPQDDEEPLKNELPRLRELLGLEE